jgi:hypothetical protein
MLVKANTFQEQLESRIMYKQTCTGPHFKATRNRMAQQSYKGLHTSAAEIQDE